MIYILGSASRIHCNAGVKKHKPQTQNAMYFICLEALDVATQSMGVIATHPIHPQATGKKDKYKSKLLVKAGMKTQDSLVKREREFFQAEAPLRVFLSWFMERDSGCNQ